VGTRERTIPITHVSRPSETNTIYYVFTNSGYKMQLLVSRTSEDIIIIDMLRLIKLSCKNIHSIQNNVLYFREVFSLVEETSERIHNNLRNGIVVNYVTCSCYK
jgi:hypothetical protein